jgi:hypothetical protein
MASISDIRTEIASVVSGALPASFTKAGAQVSAWPLSAPTPPAGEVGQFGIARNLAMGGVAAYWTCVVRVYVAVTSDQGSQERADQLLVDDPISAALEKNSTLGGAVSDLIVDRADQRFWDRPDGVILVGIEWQLRILV